MPRAGGTIAGGKIGIGEFQEFIQFEQDPPVEDVWYTALDTTANVRLIAIAIMQSNTGLTAETLQLRITIDGVTISGWFNPCNSDTWYFCYLDNTNQDMLHTTDNINVGIYTYIEGKSVKVEIEQSSDVGGGSILYCNIIYEIIEETV